MFSPFRADALCVCLTPGDARGYAYSSPSGLKEWTVGSSTQPQAKGSLGVSIPNRIASFAAGEDQVESSVAVEID